MLEIPYQLSKFHSVVDFFEDLKNQNIVKLIYIEIYLLSIKIYLKSGFSAHPI